MKAIVVFWILISLSFLEATLPGPDINDGLFLNKGTGGYCQLFFAVYRLAPTLHWQVPFCCEHRGIPPTRETSFGSKRC